MGKGLPKSSKGSIIEVELDHDSQGTFHILSQLPKRIQGAMKMALHTAAQNMLDFVTSKLPNGEDYKSFKEGLKLASVPTGKGAAFVIRLDTKARRVKKMDAGRTILFVRARKRLDRIDPRIKVLEDYGPWTPDTIPFWPERREAIVIQRKVSQRKALEVSKGQGQKKSKVEGMLAQLGNRQMNSSKKKQQQDQQKKQRRSGKAIDDMTQLALSLEFGDGGKQPMPLWRTAMKQFRSLTFDKLMGMNKKIKNAFYSVSDMQWANPLKGVDKASATIDPTFFKRLMGGG